MKKIFPILMALCLIVSPIYASWDASSPAGSDNASDLDTLLNANQEALEDSLQNMHGFVNLSVTRTNATTVVVTASSLWLQKSGTLAKEFTSVSESIAITTSGAGGLDTGSEANAWYYIFIIAKDDGTIDGLISESSSAPTMPSGYTYKTLVSAVHNTGGDFVDFYQNGTEYWYASWVEMASGNVGTDWVSVDTTEFVPSAISTVIRGMQFRSGSGNVQTTNASTTNKTSSVSGNKYHVTSADHAIPFVFNIATANTIWWLSDNANAKLVCSGFTINKLA